MKLLALVKRPASISRYLATVGEATEVPRRRARSRVRRDSSSANKGTPAG